MRKLTRKDYQNAEKLSSSLGSDQKFSSVFTNEDTTSLDQLYEELNVHDSLVLFDHVETSIEEVYGLLSSLKLNKACGPDLIQV